MRPFSRREARSRQVSATGRMGGMRAIHSLADVADRYDAVLCDVWGVIHDGRTVYPGADRALRRLRSAGLAVVLVSNVPRPSTTMPRSLARLGFPDQAWDAIVTSGDVIRAELAARAPGPVHRLGRDTDAGLWDGLGLSFVGSPADAQFLAIAGLRHRAEVPQDYTDVLREAREQDLVLLCANPDLQVRTAGQLLWCAGSVAAVYEEMGGRVVQSGKPHAPIYAQAQQVVAEVVGHRVPPQRVLAIGDGIATDLRGAAAQGLDSVFIAGGMHGDTLLDGPRVDVPQALAVLSEAGTSATYVMPQLA